MGACGLAPVVNINGEFYAKVTPMKLAADHRGVPRKGAPSNVEA